MRLKAVLIALALLLVLGLGVRAGPRLRAMAALVAPVRTVPQAAAAAGPVQQPRLGLALRPLTAVERRNTGIPGGLMVEDVTGPAAKAGILSGDIVVAVNGTEVRSIEQLRDIVARQDRLALLIARGETRIFIPLPPI
jgi:serine protease Do